MLKLVLLACYLASPVQVAPTADPVIVTVTARLPANIATTLEPARQTTAAAQKYLRFVLLTTDSQGEGPPILGTYERKGEWLTFIPRYRLTPGERYRAILTLGTHVWRFDFFAPERAAAPPAIVTAVYPSDDELPANLLKFYLHFSKPMRETPAVFNHIRIKNEKGEEVEDPWRRTELWNEDATRLTLWIHPGRIKEGVNLREEFGPVLLPGERYTLEVSDQVLDSSGRAMGVAFKKSFRTIQSVKKPIAVTEWQLSPPQVNTRQPLQLQFPLPLDHALLGHAFTVCDKNEQPILGQLKIGAGERSCAFVPEQPWKTGTYRVKVAERLEDLAGNSISRPFDRNLELPLPKNPQRSLSFQVTNQVAK